MIHSKHSRRNFLCHIARLAVVGATFSFTSSALAAQSGARSLTFEHTHTGKRLRIVYAVGNQYVPEALTSLNVFLRDHYSGEIGRMDPKLFDLLYHLKRTLGCEQPFQVISGYRCPSTNTKLRKKGSGGVAKNSLHMEGKAVDIRLADVSLADLRDAAVSSRKGGVGFYPSERFVHIDTGQIRNW